MNVALCMTALRIVASPVFVVVFLSEGLTMRILSLAIVVSMELSDALDGMIARMRKEVTDLGKLLDPLADSLSRLTILFCFFIVGIAPVWLFLIFLYRDLLVSGLRQICAAKGLVVAARTSGKNKAQAQAVAILLILGGRVLEQVSSWSLPNEKIYLWLVVMAAVVTFYSLIDYVWGNYGVIREAMR